MAGIFYSALATFGDRENGEVVGRWNRRRSGVCARCALDDERQKQRGEGHDDRCRSRADLGAKRTIA